MSTGEKITSESDNGTGRGNGKRIDKAKRVSGLRKSGKKPLDEESLISLVERMCLHEEEEYQKMKATWLHTCHESPTKDTHSSSSSSTGNIKVEERVTCGDLCELLDEVVDLPEAVVRAQTIFCSRLGLADYNRRHGTHYKMVEPLLSGRRPEGRIVLHCNFTAAKLKKKNNNTPSQPKLFYAAFEGTRTSAHDLRCCIVDPAKALRDICLICPPELAHCPCKRHELPIFYERFRWHYQDPSVLKIGLAWYNKKHGTAYKLVKPLTSNCFRDKELHDRFHCNFIAKLKNPCYDASVKLFFAEFVRSTSLTVVDCCILETAETLDSLLHLQMDLGHTCWHCSYDILHPPNYRGLIKSYA